MRILQDVCLLYTLDKIYLNYRRSCTPTTFGIIIVTIIIITRKKNRYLFFFVFSLTLYRNKRKQKKLLQHESLLYIIKYRYTFHPPAPIQHTFTNCSWHFFKWVFALFSRWQRVLFFSCFSFMLSALSLHVWSACMYSIPHLRKNT